MKKILSTILSLSILFTSIAPSYGQALESVKARRVRAGLTSYEAVQDNTRVAGVEQRQAAMEVALEKAQVQAAMFGGLPQEVKEAVAALQGEGQVDEEAVYGEYKAAYVKMMQGEMAKVLQGAASEEERAAVKAAYEDLVKESAIKRAYEKDMAVSQKEAEEAGKEYIKGLVARIYEAGQSNPVAVLGMVEEGLPVFNALGLVDHKVKVWASGVLRQEIEKKEGFCEAVCFLNEVRGQEGEKSSGY